VVPDSHSVRVENAKGVCEVLDASLRVGLACISQPGVARLSLFFVHLRNRVELRCILEILNGKQVLASILQFDSLQVVRIHHHGAVLESFLQKPICLPFVAFVHHNLKVE